MYFQEQFFLESNVHLYGSFWEDAKRSIGSGEIHSPELTAIYQRIERCPLTGEPFQIWMRGQGLAATGFLLDLVHKYSTTQPVYLSEAELAAVSESKQFIRSNLSNVPSILELCKRVAMNKNKLQKAFRLTEGKSIGEYVRTLRMEQALELLEESDMSMREIAAAIGYHGVSNFYHAFQQRFGSTPQAVRDMLKNRSYIFTGAYADSINVCKEYGSWELTQMRTSIYENAHPHIGVNGHFPVLYLSNSSRSCEMFFFPNETVSPSSITRQGTLITLYRSLRAAKWFRS